MVVVKKFRDKYTKVVYNVGENYVGDSKRVKELLKLGFLKGEEKPKK